MTDPSTSGHLIATCQVCNNTWDIDYEPPTCTCDDPGDGWWDVIQVLM